LTSFTVEINNKIMFFNLVSNSQSLQHTNFNEVLVAQFLSVMVDFYIYLIDKTIFPQILVTIIACYHNNNIFITRDPSLLLVT
jgi:hypothetical protein